MNIFRKITCAIFLVTTSLGVGSVLAQSDEANEEAAEAAAHANGDLRAEREGDTITTHGATVEKQDGSRAQVTLPDRGRADVSTPNRGLAAEGRGNSRPETAANTPRGNGKQ